MWMLAVAIFVKAHENFALFYSNSPNCLFIFFKYIFIIFDSFVCKLLVV